VRSVYCCYSYTGGGTGAGRGRAREIHAELTKAVEVKVGQLARLSFRFIALFLTIATYVTVQASCKRQVQASMAHASLSTSIGRARARPGWAKV
jgi:hypothetical protein